MLDCFTLNISEKIEMNFTELWNELGAYLKFFHTEDDQLSPLSQRKQQPSDPFPAAAVLSSCSEPAHIQLSQHLHCQDH